MREMPDVRVARVDLVLGCDDGDVVCRGIGERIFATPDIPLPPGRDDGKLGSERRVGQLEANLIVALPGAAMGQRIGPDLARDLHLAASDQRPGH